MDSGCIWWGGRQTGPPHNRSGATMAKPHEEGTGPRKRRDKRKDAQPAAAPSGRSESQSDAEKAETGVAIIGTDQKALTRWTIVLSICTLVLSAATIVGAYLLFTINLSMQKQLGVNSVQLRAYVGTQQVIYVPRLAAEQGQAEKFEGAAIGVVWKNFGATPARELEYWLSAKWYPAGAEPDLLRPSEKIAEHTFMTLAPGTEIPSPALFVPAADVARAMAGNGKVFFWGDASYRDVLPDTPQRHFHFCMMVSTMPKAINERAVVNVYKADCNFSN
ncbi:MAG: hypothetical protein ACREB8_07020 [Pseudolabrys sp.]